ncbi:MAG: transglutaminase domain-containing protein [Bacteroidota bacterium]
MFHGLRLLIVPFLLLSAVASAENGWDHIRRNDFKSAREAFLDALEKDSLDLSSLKGMIFLSETSGDDLSYNRYIYRLIANYWDENYFFLFDDEFGMAPSRILEQKKLSLRAKIDAQLIEADKLYYKRQFSDANKIYRKTLGNYQWSVIGPFKNLGGSGHIEEFPVETEPYDESKKYTDEDGKEYVWVNPPFRDGSDAVHFSDYVSAWGSSVCYASTFITVPQDRTIYIRLARKEPVKLWLDNDLVYENRERTSFEWDNEVIEVKVKAGTHRLLIKISDAASGEGLLGYGYDYGYYSPITSEYDMYEEYYASLLKGGSYGFSGRNSYYNQADFGLRITDAEGSLYEDIVSTTDRKYAAPDYTPSVTSFFVLNYFKDLVKKQPDDLFNYFALQKAYRKYYMPSENEEFFVKFNRKHPGLVVSKYLAFDAYIFNGKKEMAYEVLSGIDHAQTPIFDILYQKLQEIDKVNDEDKYLDALDNLSKISPSNMKIIKRFIEYYEKKDLMEKKQEYVKQKIKDFPQYRYFLNDELKKDLAEKKKEKKEYQAYDENYSYRKGLRKAKKSINRYFFSSDYEQLISHYKSKDDFSKVISLYDELIGIQPYKTQYYYSKAKYLFEEEKYDATIGVLNQALKLKPLTSSYYELIGDCYYEKKDKEKALEYYKQAKKLSGSSGSGMFSMFGYYGLGGAGIDFKIEKIEGQKQLKKLFVTPGFDSILNSAEWKVKYKDEDAVVLQYTKDMVFTADGEIEIYQKIMVKILTDVGTKKWIEYDFGFMGDIKASKVIKKNGAEVLPDGYGGYKVFSNLEPGDIIQMEGVSFTKTGASPLGNEFYSTTYMNFEDPVYYAKFEVAVPEGKYLGYTCHKVEDVMKKHSGKGYDFYRWEYKDIPKVAFEEAEIDKLDKWSSIMISTMPDWSKVVKWYQRKTYRKLEATYEVKEALDSIIKPGMSDRDKVEAIYNYLTREIKYSFVPFLQSGYVPKDPGQTVCSRIGDCKDVATLMITMLREVGIESYYVLVKTNDYNHQKSLPSLYFNHAIAAYYLDGKVNFLDMTTDFYPYYILPSMDANAWALLIKDGETQLLQLPKDNVDSVKNKAEISVTARLKGDRSIDMKVGAVYRGAMGGDIREELTLSNKDEQKNFILQMLGEGIFGNPSLSDYQFDNLEEISLPLTSAYSLSAQNYSDRVASMLVFRVPYMMPVNTNPAIVTDTRANSLDVSELVTVEPTLQKITLIFPEGYELLEMPKDISIESKYGVYRVTFKKTGDGLYIEKFQSFNTSVIDVKEYNAFKEYYQKLFDIDSTKIAIKKKG